MIFTGRALHFVLKIGNRGANANFFRRILGMKVLRHEEFQQGCEVECNGPYDNHWSKTMIGYGPESTHFVLELTYNYGIQSYLMGNDLIGITIQKKGIIDRAKEENYPFTVDENGVYSLKSPDGYVFFIRDEPEIGPDPIKKLSMNCNGDALEKTIDYWHGILSMTIVSRTDSSVVLTYGVDKVHLEFKTVEKVEHKKSYGRIAFAVPFDQQEELQDKIKSTKNEILTPLTVIPTPGKESVRVIILSDPNGHEICYVEEEGFSKLSEFEETSDADLTKYIAEDPFQPK